MRVCRTAWKTEASKQVSRRILSFFRAQESEAKKIANCEFLPC